MPGITGIISNRLNLENRAELDSMIACMLHEKFYKSGTFFSEAAGVAVGWVSHPGSFADCMPVWNDDKNVCLIFAGEDYQERSRNGGIRFNGHGCAASDASYLVYLYEELGLKFLEQINGWFSGLVIDLRKKQTFLFNDRFGIGRISYHEHEGNFYFSSEAKSLLKVLPHLRSLDLKSLGEVLSCGSVLQNRTLFSGVSLLPGGSVWSFSESQVATKGTYFDPKAWEKQPSLGEADYYEQLKETWQRILPRYLPGGESAGLSLTGGVDSRMILAWAPRQPGELPCYTFSGRYRDCNDVKLARRLAKLSQQPYHTIPIDGQFLSEFPSLAEKVAYVGEGNLDASGTIDLFVQREARKIAPIRVTGTNGGELLRRLVMFKPAGLPEEMLSPEMKRSTTEAASTYAEELKCHRLSFAAFKQTPWYMNSKFIVERSQITMRLPFCDNELVRLSYQAPPTLAEANEPALRLIAEGNSALRRLGTDRGLQFHARRWQSPPFNPGVYVQGRICLRHGYAAVVSSCRPCLRATPLGKFVFRSSQVSSLQSLLSGRIVFLRKGDSFGSQDVGEAVPAKARGRRNCSRSHHWISKPHPGNPQTIDYRACSATAPRLKLSLVVPI
jgi:asparagine synthase (glutamine-hydrolysing)